VKRALALAATLACIAALRAPARAEWRPPDLRPTKTPLAEVLAAYTKGTGALDSRFAQRRERWTYVNGPRRLPVRVTVLNDDFRANVELNGAEYAGGRWSGLRWRADANGIAHGTLSDDQGDAVDRLPQSVFPFAMSECELAGESEKFAPAWVLADRAPHDRPHWLYVDKTSGLISHEVTREGARTIVTSFEDFEPLGTLRRPRRWHVTDGNRTNDLDVHVDAIEPAQLMPRDVATPPTQRTFRAPNARDGIVVLPAHFRGRTIFVDAGVDGRRAQFVLDTGTASITLDSGYAGRRGWSPVLEHATVPHMTVGALALDDVSTLAIPINIGYSIGGILGYDFFVGHVVHVDYANERVEVMTPEAAAPIFRDGKATVIPADFDEGVPLVRAAFGSAVGDRFALDTGSPHLYVLAPFEQRYKTAIDALWTPASFGRQSTAEEVYLEGSIVVSARRVASFTLGPQRFYDVLVGIQQPNAARDAIDIALDGIVGTDQMRDFDWWFDYEGGRIALRRNGLR